MSGPQGKTALDAAATLLARRPLSVKMLCDKLVQKGFDRQQAEEAAEWLRARGLLNDFAFAEGVVRVCTRKGYGAQRIRLELTRRGVDAETAAAALANFESNPAQLEALLDKRLRGDVSDRTAVDRAAAALARRGFSSGEIRRAVERYVARHREME